MKTISSMELIIKMILYIKQTGQTFRYRRRSYKTPLTFPFAMESVANIVTQLYKQKIVDYTITPDSIRIKNVIAKNKKIKYEPTVIKEKTNTESTSDIKGMLLNILDKIDNISINNVVDKKSVYKKKKNDENTFIPQIDTKGMGIKTNIRTEKSSNNTTSSADVLRQLLKGI